MQVVGTGLRVGVKDLTLASLSSPRLPPLSESSVLLFWALGLPFLVWGDEFKESGCTGLGFRV